MTAGPQAKHTLDAICARVSSLHKPALIEYDEEEMIFDVSVVRDSENSTPYPLYIGSFRLADPEFGFEEQEAATPAELKTLREAVVRILKLLQIRLHHQNGRAFAVYARAGSPLTQEFSLIPSDVLKHFDVTDWTRGQATANNGETLFSMHIGPLTTLSNEQQLSEVPEIDRPGKRQEIARYIRDVHDSRRPECLTMDQLKTGFLKYKGNPKGKAPDTKTMNRGIALAIRATRGAGT